MKTLNFKLSIALFCLFLCFSNVVKAQDNQLKLGNVEVGEIDFKSFELSQEGNVLIEGMAGSFDRWSNDLVFYGWIIDAKSRKVVWHLMEEANDEFYDREDDGKFSFEQELSLPSGKYEAYFAGAMDYRKGNNIEINDIGDFLDALFDELDIDRSDFHSRYIEKLGMTISGVEGEFKVFNGSAKVDAYKKNAFFSTARANDNEFKKQFFSLDSETELNIYTIGEQRNDDYFDDVRIIDLNSYKQVWPNDATKYVKAGGAKKNRMAFQSFKLGKGEYVVYYVSDDSHSFEKWNMLPPFDPQMWGATIWTAQKDRDNVKLLEKNEREILNISKVRDDEYRSQGFTLEKDMDLRIVSLGERSSRHYMVDYGWIVNASTGETVWELEEEESKYAGGGSKNRMVNEKITLEKGNYIAYYASDDSHSYEDWNTNPPLMQDLWGMIILAEPKDIKSFKLREIEELTDKNIIAEIVRVRDHAEATKEFSLNDDQKIRILAIGEGSGNHMHDTGWITDSKGEIVWEMTMRKTKHAGGAKKNRMFNGVIMLPEGDYTLHYESDDSHSYRNWNSTPPRNQERYGITIFKVED